MKRIFLVTISALALVACGNSDEPVATPTTTATTPMTPTPSAQQQPAPAVGNSDQTDQATNEPIDPNGPVDWNTEELPENNSVPGGSVDEAPSCLSLTSTSTTDAVASLPEYFQGEPWVATRIGDGCAPFTWVRADTGGTAASPVHILFFHDADYLGTATLEPTAFTSVVAQSADTVTVQYRWPLANDANANPTGGPVTIDYRWDGSQVNMIGTLPPEVIG